MAGNCHPKFCQAVDMKMEQSGTLGRTALGVLFATRLKQNSASNLSKLNATKKSE